MNQMSDSTKDMDRQQALEEEIRASLIDGFLPCASAFDVARKLKVPVGQVGAAANRLRIRIIACQLGFFTLKKAAHDDLGSEQVKATVAREIETSLVNGGLACAVALNIARRLEIPPKEVGDTATILKIKIRSCQLGCFP